MSSLRLPEDICEDDIFQWLSDGYVSHPDHDVLMFDGGLDMYDSTAAFFDGDEHIRLPYHDVECIWPICGMVNRRVRGWESAVYVKRVQRRQWRRTFNARCVDVIPVGRWALAKYTGIRGNSRLTMDIVRELVEPTYYTMGYAMSRIQNTHGCLSLAITPQIAISGDGKGKFAVYYRDKVIGGIHDKVFTPSVINQSAKVAENLVMEALDVST